MNADIDLNRGAAFNNTTMDYINNKHNTQGLSPDASRLARERPDYFSISLPLSPASHYD